MFTRTSFVLPLAITCTALPAAAQETNVSVAKELINLLSATEICLNTCHSAADVQAVLPQLKHLAQKAAEIKEKQSKLPDFTPADDKEIAKLIPTYTTLSKAINAHLQRLSDSGLMSPELRAVLGYSGADAPPTTN